MEPLAYTTSIMSWQFILSAINMICSSQPDIDIDLNLDTPPSVILACVSLEAFSNEMSSLTSAFIFDINRDYYFQYLTPEQQKSKIGIHFGVCQDIKNIKENKKGSFYERYKTLLKTIGIKSPDFLDKLCYLCNLRDSFVHFRLCDIPIIEDKNGYIRYAQEPPEVFAHLKAIQIKEGWSIIAESEEDEWTLRISTNAMAIWSLSLVLDAIIYVLNNLPEGIYKDFIFKAYKSRDESFENVFEMGKCKIQNYVNHLLTYSELL